MHDVFISYKRQERDAAQQLAQALTSRGWSVWWDVELLAGEHFDDRIEEAIRAAKIVIVLWSKSSTKSRYVKDEATFALKLKKLLPVALEELAECDLPMKFQGLHTISLIGWQGSVASAAFQELERTIEVQLSGSREIRLSLTLPLLGTDSPLRRGQYWREPTPVTAADLGFDRRTLLKLHRSVRSWVAGPHYKASPKRSGVTATAPEVNWECLTLDELIDIVDFLEQPFTPRTSMYSAAGRDTQSTVALVRKLLSAMESKAARSVHCIPDQLQKLPANLKKLAVRILLCEPVPDFRPRVVPAFSGQSIHDMAKSFLPTSPVQGDVLTLHRLEEYRELLPIGGDESHEIDQIAELLGLRKS